MYKIKTTEQSLTQWRVTIHTGGKRPSAWSYLAKGCKIVTVCHRGTRNFVLLISSFIMFKNILLIEKNVFELDNKE